MKTSYGTQDISFMKIALSEAKKAFSRSEVPVGCIITSKGKIIAKGFNARESRRNPLSHAEINAISKACNKLKGFRLNECDIYVTLEPCLMCLGAILQSRMRRIVFACENPKEGAVSLLPTIRRKLGIRYKIRIESGVLEEESSSLLKSFFRKLRRSRK